MIALLFKNWKLFLDILMVVGAILAFTFWDPIGMFTNSRTKQTANLVTGVRDIGQLVTAEYYGEVISSWKEFKLTEFPEDTLTDYAEKTFQDIQFLVWQYRGERPRNFFSRLRQDAVYQSFTRHAAYPELVAMLADRYTSKKLNNIYAGEQLQSGIEEKTYRSLLNEIKGYEKELRKKYNLKKRQENDEFLADVEDYLFDTPAFIYDFFAYYQFLVQETSTRKEKKKNIVFIGRGSVRAGFDFGVLNESNFLYDEDEKIVHFYGIKPSVLDVDINPWFIPERKVKGFELVSYSGDVNFMEAKEVKKQCKQKLLNQARNASIIQRAEENGQEALRNFFSLLLDEPELEVAFHTHPYDQLLAIIKADTLVDRIEATVVDSLYHRYRSQLDTLNEAKGEKSTQHFKRFITGLKSLYFLNEDYRFSYYSLVANQILKDTFHVDSMDFNLLITARDTLRTSESRLYTTITNTHEIWFSESDFRNSFNEMIHLIEQESLSSFDSTLDLAVLKFQSTDLDRLESIFEHPDTLYNTSHNWQYLNAMELDTLKKVQMYRAIRSEKLAPLAKLKTGINEFIDRLKK